MLRHYHVNVCPSKQSIREELNPSTLSGWSGDNLASRVLERSFVGVILLSRLSLLTGMNHRVTQFYSHFMIHDLAKTKKSFGVCYISWSVLRVLRQIPIIPDYYDQKGDLHFFL
ncbi:MAG: hypothetical protein ACFFCZ_21510 [Promethearchaeota archaeon]